MSAAQYRIKKVADVHTPEVVVNGVWTELKLSKSILLECNEFSEKGAREIISAHRIQSQEPEYIYIKRIIEVRDNGVPVSSNNSLAGGKFTLNGTYTDSKEVGQ